MPQIQDLRLKIQNQLEYNKAHPDQPAVTSGTYDLHYVDDSAPERAWTAIKNLFSILTGGEVGMPIEQGFTGSYDLSWQFLGYDDNGNAVIEYHLENASTWASGVPNPLKVFLYPGENEENQSAGDGHDAAPGEYWLQESVRWRETFDGDKVPAPPDANPWGTADNCCVPGL
jgi:hypothetical protein